MALTGRDINAASSLLKGGKLVAIPTETVYGLAANALDEKAVREIFNVKQRPANNPLIIHIAGKGQLDKYVKEIPEAARKLANSFWPGPVTLLLSKKKIIPDVVTASLPRVAVRIPEHPMTLDLLRTVNFPLAAPSANPSGYISPTAAAHVEGQIGDKISYILDGGSCKRGVESTIIGFEENIPVVYRLGAITIEEIERTIGKVRLHDQLKEQPDTPGQLPSHYSPATPLILTDDIESEIENFDPDTTGVITFSKKIKGLRPDNLEILSPEDNIRIAAQNLYSALHRLDKKGLKVIIAERFPDEELGKTINDRLKRAAYKHEREQRN